MQPVKLVLISDCLLWGRVVSDEDSCLRSIHPWVTLQPQPSHPQGGLDLLCLLLGCAYSWGYAYLWVNTVLYNAPQEKAGGLTSTSSCIFIFSIFLSLQIMLMSMNQYKYMSINVFMCIRIRMSNITLNDLKFSKCSLLKAYFKTTIYHIWDSVWDCCLPLKIVI